ncbi:unnamed protein product [Trifolium pratense]|uniref:Uncharacterized protein n=1 Tax=Trifolium pratense TaxID=57577 RepID=A0ACB0IWU8_TRIPR|nr:unnamed protein product [Trifolium pratense]
MQKVFGAWLYSNEIGLFMKDRLASRTFRLTRQKEVAATVCCCFSSIKPFISLEDMIRCWKLTMEIIVETQSWC